MNFSILNLYKNKNNPIKQNESESERTKTNRQLKEKNEKFKLSKDYVVFYEELVCEELPKFFDEALEPYSSNEIYTHNVSRRIKLYKGLVKYFPKYKNKKNSFLINEKLIKEIEEKYKTSLLESNILNYTDEIIAVTGPMFARKVNKVVRNNNSKPKQRHSIIQSFF